jgi:hypothetical protein
MEADPGVTVTDATGTSDTVMVDEPVRPSLNAVIVAVPGAIPVTRPLEFTSATPPSVLDQVIALPLNATPF